MDSVASEAAVSRPRVVLGVSGGIAAYKACELLRRFTESGHDVTVVPTAAALRFVGAATWAALSGKPVSTEVWDEVHVVPHVRIGQEADLVVVAPATADLMARVAHGLADDLLTIDAVLFLGAMLSSYFALRVQSLMRLHWLERVADICFIVAMIVLTVACFVVTYWLQQ